MRNITSSLETRVSVSLVLNPRSLAYVLMCEAQPRQAKPLLRDCDIGQHEALLREGLPPPTPPLITLAPRPPAKLPPCWNCTFPRCSLPSSVFLRAAIYQKERGRPSLLCLQTVCGQVWLQLAHSLLVQRKPAVINKAWKNKQKPSLPGLLAEYKCF